MTPWNSAATAQDHLAAARDSLPCDLCGGPGWMFGGGYGVIGLIRCAECNDDDHKSAPVSLDTKRYLTRPPEPWTPTDRLWAYACEQCGLEALVARWRAGWGWTCHCLAVAETEAGVIVLKFPQPLPMGVPDYA